MPCCVQDLPAPVMHCLPQSVVHPNLNCGCLQDSQEWKRIAKLSTEQGHLRQAIYCYKNVRKQHWKSFLCYALVTLTKCCMYLPLQAINHDKSDLDAKWDKAVLHDTIGEPRKASISGTSWTLLSLHLHTPLGEGSVVSWRFMH